MLTVEDKEREKERERVLSENVKRVASLVFRFLSSESLQVVLDLRTATTAMFSSRMMAFETASFETSLPNLSKEKKVVQSNIS